MKTYGLVGKNIEYSFSRSYFKKKFDIEGISAEYLNFDLQQIDFLPELLKKYKSLKGLNVTIPYKEKIIPFLDKLDPTAAEIGAVNTVKIEKDDTLTGFNTDHFGFRESLKAHLKPYHSKALILGTGGASKAVAYSLKELDIPFQFVSRTPQEGAYTYSNLTAEIMEENKILINCTPLGTYPGVENCPPVPYDHFTSSHLVYDLIYNPPVTSLMKKALEKGATAINGQRMLELQAEKAWEIWNLP